METQSILKLVQSAFMTPDNTIRNQCENQVIAFSNSNPNEFVSQLSEGFASPNEATPFRVMYGTILRKFLKVSSPTEGSTFWKVLHPDVKEKLFIAGLSCMVYQDQKITNTSANLIANVFVYFYLKVKYT